MTDFNLSEQITDLLSSPSLFRDWLKSFDPDDEVGIAIECEDCPIARFLKSNGCGDISVYKYEIGNKDGTKTLVELIDNSSPELAWATHFISQIDDGDLVDPPDSVKAKTAIQTLDEFRL